MGTWREKHARRAARNKGKAYENTVAKMLRHIFPNAKRHLEFQFQEAHGIDLDNTGPYRIQIKKHRAYVPVTTINEVQCERLLGEVPILVTAGDGLEAMAVLPFEDLISMMEKIHLTEK